MKKLYLLMLALFIGHTSFSATFTGTPANDEGQRAVLSPSMAPSVQALDTSVTRSPFNALTKTYTLTANATGVTYQWIDCNNAKAFITGETNKTLVVNKNGSYAVIITSGVTKDTGSCRAIQLPPAGASLRFDGIDDVVNIGATISPALSTKNQVTVEAWVYPTNNTINGAIVGNLAYPSNNGEQSFFLRSDDNKEYAFFVDDNNGYKGVYSGANTLVINTWQHVVGVWDGSSIYIYIDGVLMKSQSGVTGPHLFATTNSVAIGGNDADQFFEGNIDEVRIWSRALCQQEITADRNCEVPTIAPGLLGNYHFNQGSDNVNNAGITTLTDASGSNNNGTLLNFALTGITSNWSAKAGVTSGLNCVPYNGITSVSISSQTDVSCHGKNDGAVTLSVVGISPSYSWAPSGGTAATATGLAAGTYTCTVTSGCSGSIPKVVTITEPAAIATTQALFLCAGQSVTIGIHTYTTNGTYTDVLKAKNNCDSTVTTNLTVSPVLAHTQAPVLCAGQSITVGTHTYTTTGTYTDVVKSWKNCDSTVTTNLTVNPAIVTNQSPTLCAGQSITVGTHTYTTTGTYTDVLKAKNNCDSTVNTNLIVNPAIITNLSPTLCAGQSITVGTHTYTTTGTYTDVVKSWKNCDSTINTNLIVNPAIVTNQSPTLCAGQSIIVGTNTYTATGTYTDVLKAKNNCDSTVNTNLIVNPAIITNQSPTLCAGQSITVGTHTYTTTGTYTDVVKSWKNCDSTVNTNLTIQSAVDVGITTVGNVITANATGAVYQWIDCNNGNSILAGQTGQSYTAAQNGHYAVIVKVGACSDTSICQQIIITGIQDIRENKLVEIYPNPTAGLLNIVLPSDQQVLITNAIGQIVYNHLLTSGKHLIDLQQEPTGLYVIRLIGNHTTQTLKLMKE